MQSDEWADLNTGDVLQNRLTEENWVVVDPELQSEGISILSRTIAAQNPGEWTRMRKTVDTEELIQREAEKAAAFAKQSKS